MLSGVIVTDFMNVSLANFGSSKKQRYSSVPPLGGTGT